MGTIKLAPEAGDTYTAFWKDEKGSEQTTPLPAAKNIGVTIEINSTAQEHRLYRKTNRGQRTKCTAFSRPDKKIKAWEV